MLGASRIGALPGVTGTGRIMNLRFKGLKTGTCDFNLEELKCRNPGLSLYRNILAFGGKASSTLGP